MNKEGMKNMVILKDLPSNIVEEAIVILKPNIKLKNLDFPNNKKGNKKASNKENSKNYIINEAQMIVSNYISKIEQQKKVEYAINKKMEKKYKMVKIISIFLGTLLIISLII